MGKMSVGGIWVPAFARTRGVALCFVEAVGRLGAEFPMGTNL